MRNKERRKYVFISAFVIGIILFIAYTLSRFNSDIQERVYEKQIGNMKDLSMQGSAVVEKKLAGLVNTLYGMAEFIEEDELTENSNMADRLLGFLEKRDIGFQRIGIADADGNARVTSGEELDISERDYFRKCMEEKHAATEIRQSSLVDKPVCIVAVPILKENEKAIGVIYGVTELSMFRIYDETVLENKNQYVQVIDMDGNYIRKQTSSLIGKKDNIFDGISSIEGEEYAENIRAQIQEEKQVYTEVSDGNHHEILYFTPLKMNDWCIVTAIDYSEVTDSVDYILKNDVYIMIMKIIFVLVLLFLMVMYYSYRERERIREYNERLVMDEKITRIAAEKSGFVIMSYGIKSRQLRFINNKFMDIHFPRQVDNAPEEFLKYVPENEELREQIRTIFRNMESGRGKREFLLNFVHEGKKLYLSLQLISIAEENGEIRQCIGLLEDATEEQKLRDKADRDPLTGLYNRNSAMEKIEQCVKGQEPQPGMTHAYMIMDIDNFKTLNDTLGHQMGDKALQEVANILNRHFRSYDIVCRLGGDEFMVFMKNIPRNVIGRNVASLLKKLTLTYEEGGKSVQVTASAGITLVSDTATTFTEMYRRADEALYQVKHETKNDYKIYEE